MGALSADESWRRTNLGHLLFAATGFCIRDKLEVVHGSGFKQVTGGQLSLIQHLQEDGDRLTELAARAAIAKQSMIELVDKLEAMELVRRDPDPTDRRAKIVRFTLLGLELHRAMRLGLQRAEQRFGTIVGVGALAPVKRGLNSYSGGSFIDLERVLADAGQQFVGEVLRAAHQRGHVEVTEAQLGLFRHLDLNGSRLTDVAAAARITKQSMRMLVAQAEFLGLVERSRILGDGRVKVIRFSSRGLRMLDDMRSGIAKAEQTVGDLIGADQLAQLKTILAAYIYGAQST